MAETIYDISLCCFQGFTVLLSKCDTAVKSYYQDQMPPRKVEVEYGRFKIWLGNLGALQRGHGSLDYRVRESSVMQANILRLLQQLHTNLEESTSILDGTRLPFELVRPEWSSEDDSDSSDSSNGDHIQSTMTKSELRQRLASIGNILDDLYKLSFKLRNASLKPRAGKAAMHSEIDKETGVELFSEYHKFDRLHITELIRQMRGPSSDQGVESDYLVDRLSHALTARRRQFRYWRKHGNKLSQHVPHKIHSERAQAASALETPKEPRHVLKVHSLVPDATPSTISRSIVSATEATTYDKKLDDMLETQSVISYATTIYDTEGRTIQLPAPPTKASTGSGFVCPYCMILCPPKHGSGRGWRTHILHDLQPYICTYPDCSTRAFSSRRQWLEHEGAIHRKVWRCFEHSSAVFSSVAGYQDHLRAAHEDQYDQLSNVLDVAETYLADERDTCPLCLERFTPGLAFHHHLAFHMESIACFALPRDVQEEKESSLVGSDAPQGWSDESRASLASAPLSFASVHSASATTTESRLMSIPLHGRSGINDSPTEPFITEPDFPVEDEKAMYEELPHTTGNAMSREETVNVPGPASITSAAGSDVDWSSDDDLFAIKPQRGPAGKGKQNVISNPLNPGASENLTRCPAEGCSATFERTGDFNLHMKQHGAPQYTCESWRCGDKFYRFEQLKEHVLQEHGMESWKIDRLAPGSPRQSNVGQSGSLPFPPPSQPAEMPSQEGKISGPRDPKGESTSSAALIDGGKANFLKGELIGVGSWSKARSYLGMDNSSGQLLVVKEIQFSDDSAKRTAEDGRLRMRVDLVKRLIDIVKRLEHSNIIRYYGHLLKENTYSILIEYISGGTLAACVASYGKFPSSMVSNFVRQILQGLAYLHHEGIIHRDLTANKIFLASDGTCKIGWSFMMEKVDEVYGMRELADARFGSIYWMAPEVIKSQGKGYSGKADVWSLGGIAYEALSGRRPFSKDELISAIYKLGGLSETPPIADDVAAELEPDALAFLYDCWTIDPTERPTAVTLLTSPFAARDRNTEAKDSSPSSEIGEASDQAGSDSSQLEERKQVSSVGAGEPSERVQHSNIDANTTSTISTDMAAKDAGFENFETFLLSYGLRIYNWDDVEEGKGILTAMGYNLHPAQADSPRSQPAFVEGAPVYVRWLAGGPRSSQLMYVSLRLYDERTQNWVYQLIDMDGQAVKGGRWFMEKDLSKN